MNEERCTLHMKINKKMLFASTVALSVFPLITANAEEESQIGQLGQLIKSKLTLLVVKINRLIQSNMAILLEQLRKHLTWM